MPTECPSLGRSADGGRPRSVRHGDRTQRVIRRRLGVIVNPVAGIGGSVALNGSDGGARVAEARARGGVSRAPERALYALREISPLRGKIDVITPPSEMGEWAARAAGFAPNVFGVIAPGQTTAVDTRMAALEMERRRVDLLVFAGGDGTAADIASAIGRRITALGIPAGVKMHSAVFGITPRRAGETALRYLSRSRTEVAEAEVMDVRAKFADTGGGPELLAYLRIPSEPALLQDVKAQSPETDAAAQWAAARAVLERLPAGALTFVGPGTTTGAMLRMAGVEPTLTGVDVIRGRTLVSADSTERELLELASSEPAFVVVTPVGGQGFLFGRGNQPLSAKVLLRVDRDRIVVVATPAKLAALRRRKLLVDTGDEQVDELLSGYVRVIVGTDAEAVYRVGA
jgi:predicted polyphosphate/ATP-dependent NAD kinase